jgi:hypothetical protein
MRYLLTSILCLAVILSIMACTPKLVGPTASTSYFFVVYHPNAVLVRIGDEIIVKVQDAAGQPVDGLPVMFEVDASWSGNATINPARIPTHKGRASAFFNAGVLGRVPVQVTVDGTTQEVIIAVDARGDIPSGA